MGDFKEKCVYSYKLKPLIWKRFINNIFFIWTYSDAELNNLSHTLIIAMTQSNSL